MNKKDISTNKPNVILLVLDSARRDLFGSYGNTEGLTPNIDEIAKEGAVLMDHYASGCGSAQAHVSLFLGQHSYRHGVVHNLSEMKEDVVALPKLLKEVGYKTYGHCMASFIPPAGFEDLFCFDEFYYPGKVNTKVKPSLNSSLVGLLKKNPKIFNLAKNTYKKLLGQAATIKASAKNFDGQASLDFLFKRLLKEKGKNPTFAYTTLLHPHTPYYAPDWCIKKVFGDDKVNSKAFDIQANMHAWVNGDFGDVPEAIDSLAKLYKAELIYADHLVGEFIKMLKDSELYDNTLLIITADHGEMLGEHGLLNHGATVWEEVQRVPAIISYPKQFQPESKINKLTSGLDFMPTILDCIGEDALLKQSTQCDGWSIIDESQQWENRYLVVDAPPLVLPQRLKAYPKVVAKGSVFHRAIRNTKYKYIWQSNGRNYLFPVGVQENDQSNVLNDNKEMADELHDKMVAWYKGLNVNFKIDEYQINMGATAAKKMTNPIIRQELKKLGYL